MPVIGRVVEALVVAGWLAVCMLAVLPAWTCVEVLVTLLRLLRLELLLRSRLAAVGCVAPVIW